MRCGSRWRTAWPWPIRSSKRWPMPMRSRTGAITPWCISSKCWRVWTGQQDLLIVSHEAEEMVAEAAAEVGKAASDKTKSEGEG